MRPLPGSRSAAVAQRPRLNATRIGLVVVVLLIVFALARGIFGHHENTYEKIAHGMTAALQANDLAGVQKYQNAETATLVTHQIVGRDADVLSPLGKIDDVRQTAAEPARRIYQFDVKFDKGTVHETIRFDPQDKVVGFKYDPPATQ